MISLIDYNKLSLTTRGDSVSCANIIIREKIVSINYITDTKLRHMDPFTAGFVIDIPFSCDSLSITEVMAKLEKIISLSLLTPSSVEDKIIYHQMGVRPHQQLSNAENKMLRYIGMGYCPQDIANKLGCSDKTISTHCRNTMRKMDFSKKTELYYFASCVMQHRDRERVTLCL